MARILAAIRLLWIVTRRSLKGLSSLSLNNLFFCVAFLVQGSRSPDAAFRAALPFLIVLAFPLLVAVSAETLDRIPVVRKQLWPLTSREQLALGIVGLAMSPAFWLFGGALALWAGPALGLCFVAFSIALQGLTFVAARLNRVARGPRWLRLVRTPGKTGGITRVALRQIFRTLDFYTALLLSIAGTAYRFAADRPKPEAFPILALLISISLSTYAQRMFGLESPGSMARYRLLPLAGWRIMLAKDLAYLGVLAILTLPLTPLPAMSFGLIAIAVGRYPSLRQKAQQQPWRFTSGDVRFGGLQILLGGMVAMATLRISHWFAACAITAYGLSLIVGNIWWRNK